MTQRQLAEAAGTSQQQIQRIESGVQAVRYHQAVGIAMVLGETCESVFPQPRGSVRTSTGSTADGDQPDKASSGVDKRPERWTLWYRLRGGAEGTVPIAGEHVRNLRSSIADGGGDTTFVVFDSHTSRVALNRVHLLACQFLAEPDLDHPLLPPNLAPNVADEDDASTLIYLADAAAPIEMTVVSDQADMMEMVKGNDDGSGCVNQIALRELDLYLFENESRIRLIDEDGYEEMFFRAKDIAMLVMPLAACEPSLLRSMDEGDAEDLEQAAARGEGPSLV
jgi:transcriptional regulator with XRE-family HTH domain